MPEKDSTDPRPVLAVEEGWPDRVAEKVESAVAEIRQRSYVPLRTAATALVLGILIGAMASLASVLVVIATARVVNSYIFPGRIWAGYLIVGGIFCIAGLLMWSKRRRR